MGVTFEEFMELSNITKSLEDVKDQIRKENRMGTRANAWRYLFLLLSEGYEVRFSDYLSGHFSITVEIKKGYYNARWAITRDSLEKNMLGDNLLMYEILKKLREMIDAQAAKGENND